MNKETIRRYLEVIKRAVVLIETQLESPEEIALPTPTTPKFVEIVEPVIKPPIKPSLEIPKSAITPLVIPGKKTDDQSAQQVLDPEFVKRRHKHLDDLMAITCWPEAVAPFLAVREISEEDQVNRANAVLDMTLDRQVRGLRFLDFGCGDGWVAKEIVRRGVAESVGYDPTQPSAWKDQTALRFVSNPKELTKNRFDIVMAYDVFDHCKNPEEAVGQVFDTVRKGGVVYVRCHPWTSKHGTHLFRQGINRAYFHMFLTTQEIAELTGQEPAYTHVEFKPLEFYRRLFGKQFEVKKERPITETVNEFFHVPAFKELLASEHSLPIQEIDGLLATMQVQFVDFQLVPKK